jgi:hypothetical protein
MPAPGGEWRWERGWSVVVVIFVLVLCCSLFLILTDHEFQRLAELKLYEVLYYVRSNRLIGV